MGTKINRTFSFNQYTIDALELLMTNANISNASDYLRQLIDDECVRQKISIDKEEYHHTVSNRNERSELVRAVKNNSLEIAKQNAKLNEITKMLYQLRDGQNSYLNEINVDPTPYESETESDKVKQHPALVNAAANYDKKMRRLAIEKQNSGKQENR